MTPCKVCGRAVGKRGIPLYATPRGQAAVCCRKCLAAYEGPDGGPCDCGAHGDQRGERAGRGSSRRRRGATPRPALVVAS